MMRQALIRAAMRFRDREIALMILDAEIRLQRMARYWGRKGR